MYPNILIALPVYNEEKFIGDVLRKIHAAAPNIPILVVNDGSVDETSRLIRRFDVHLVEHENNLGKGEAIRSAFSYALEKGYDWIIFLDGDGQHPPKHLRDFISEIIRGRADVVLGNRQKRAENMPVHRQLSNGITSVIISICSGQRIRDSQCGYRAVRIGAMKNIILKSQGFQVESEMLIKLGKAGASFSHLEIDTIYGGESSAIRLVDDTFKFIQLVLKSFWW